ncbi:MAG: copper amine oxidase N-terminal domain-containing protein, partial [Candidatus Cryosericum sp.]
MITAAPVPTTPLGTVTLATPTQVAGTTSVLLSWTYSAADVTAFQIYRNTALIAYVAPGTTTYTDAATVAGQYYTYYIMPINAQGNGTQSFTQPILVAAATATTTTAATGTLGITTTGTFVGGIDGSGVAAVNGIGKVVNIIDANTAVVNVTTAAAGSFDTVNGVKLLHIFTAGAIIDTDWYNTGSQLITFSPAEPTFTLGQTITVGASGTLGSGKITSINAAGTTAYVNVTTAAVGIFDGNVYTRTYVASTDLDWETVGATQVITIPTAGIGAGDLLTAYMTQAVPATSASAFFMVTGAPVKGDVATVTFQDSAAASHTVTYTAAAGDTAATVAQTLSQLIDAMDTASGYDFVYSTYTVGASVVQLTQENAGTVGNGKTLTGTTTAAVVPTLTISTLGGLNQPAYVEQGKTLQLVAKDATGAVVSVAWTSSVITNATVSTTGLVTAASVASNLTGVTVITATSGTATGVFAVVVIPVQTITSMSIKLVSAVPVSTTSQQFGAIASNAAYSALDYTTQAVWTDALPVASIAAVNGLLTYSTDETGVVNAYAAGITATANVKIATGVVTLVPVVGPVTRVIVLTIGTDIVTVDGKATSVDAAPEIINGRTFVPIRFIAETFGSTVTWLP